MEQNLSKVRIEDFNISELRKAAREGRLYIRPSDSPMTVRNTGINQILKYVSRIDECTSSDYRSHIREIWVQILHDSMLRSLFFMQKGSRKDQPNWYRVTSVVCILREWNVYRQKDFTGVDLHLLMEGISKHNSILTSSSHYYLNHSEIVQLRHILQNFDR